MKIPIISSMGAGNKMNPAMFQVADIYQTSIDPLAKVMRRELRKRGIDSLKVAYSKEKPMKPQPIQENNWEQVSGQDDEISGREGHGKVDLNGDRKENLGVNGTKNYQEKNNHLAVFPLYRQLQDLL